MFAVADQRRFRSWLLASAFVHALGAVLLVAARPLPSPPREPLRVVRVDLIAGPAAPGPPAAPPAPEAAAPPPAPLPLVSPKPRVPAKPPPPKAMASTKAVAPAPPTPALAAPSAAESAAPAAGSIGGSGAAEGATLAAVSAGPPGGGGGSGADVLADYIARLQRAIDEHKSYPSMARRRGIEGVVTVRLAIDARGVLAGTSLVGRPPEILARSTREAVDRASPFPPPPGGALQVEFPVRYEIVD